MNEQMQISYFNISNLNLSTFRIQNLVKNVMNIVQMKLANGPLD